MALALREAGDGRAREVCPCQLLVSRKDVKPPSQRSLHSGPLLAGQPGVVPLLIEMGKRRTGRAGE